MIKTCTIEINNAMIENRGVCIILLRGRGWAQNDFLQISRNSRGEDILFGNQYSQCYMRGLVCYRYMHKQRKRRLTFFEDWRGCAHSSPLRSPLIEKGFYFIMMKSIVDLTPYPKTALSFEILEADNETFI